MSNKRKAISTTRKLQLIESVLEDVFANESMSEGYDDKYPLISVDAQTMKSIKTFEDAAKTIESFAKDNRGDTYSKTMIQIFSQGEEQDFKSGLEKLKELMTKDNYDLINIDTNVANNEWKERFLINLQVEPSASQGRTEFIRTTGSLD